MSPNTNQYTSAGRRRGRRIALLVVLALAGAACSDDGPGLRADQSATDTDSADQSDGTTDDTGATTPTAPTTPPAVTQPDTSGSDEPGAIHAIADAESGTIQIGVSGSLRDPELGSYTVGGHGSGFFIDPSGLAVTNNHVVTGAATIEVLIGGDRTASYNARVVGVSECNDLALIQVDTAEPVPYFSWYDDEVRAGIDVYAAGYPLGDPQFTLTKGIVAKARASGDITGTSSIDHTIEHDASTQPGSSGGPLLAADGSVVGIVYAGGARDVGAQYYGISADLAEDVVSELGNGDFESLGVNGFAVADPDSGLAGIWVSGVAAGTSASRVGLLPGDIITSMNGLPVGTDGTFSDYCDVIRTAGDKPIAIEVLRFDTQELLSGEINGDQPLETTFSFDDDVDDTDMADADAYASYVTVADDSGRLSVQVPSAWADIVTAGIDDGAGGQYPRIAASTDIDTFTTSFTAPGVQFLAVPDTAWTIDTVLAEFAVQAESCTDGGVSDYDDGAFTGRFQVWESCGGTDTILVVLATTSNVIGGSIYLTSVQAVTSADLDALDRIVSTYTVS